MELLGEPSFANLNHIAIGARLKVAETTRARGEGVLSA